VCTVTTPESRREPKRRSYISGRTQNVERIRRVYGVDRRADRQQAARYYTRPTRSQAASAAAGADKV